MMLTPRKRVRVPFTLSPSIEVAIVDKIAASHRKRCRTPSPPPSSPPPSPSVSPPPPAMLPPHKRFRVTFLQQDTTNETMNEAIIPIRLSRAPYHAITSGEIGLSRDTDPRDTRSPRRASSKEIGGHETGFLRADQRLGDSFRGHRGLLNMLTTRQGLNSASIEKLIAQCVADAMATYEAIRNSVNGANNETSISARGVDHTELALVCPTMVTPEYKMIEMYIWGLIDDIQGNFTSSKPKRIREAIRMAHDLMDQVVRSKAAKSSKNKRKWETTKGSTMANKTSDKRL
ncbi:hypothetical protein Tco_1037752 [Tanacetum coccineum]